MSIAGSLIGAGGSLIGGLLGKQKGYSPREQGLGHVEGMMQASEAFGINPLFLLGNVAAGGGIPSQNYMGSAIADASMLLADAVSKNKEKQQLTRANERVGELQKKIENLTLRPKVGGIYAQNEMTPTLGSALGRGGNAQGITSGDNPVKPSGLAGDTGGVRPLAEQLEVDPRRPVDNTPITTTSGFMVVDNPNMPFPIYMPTADGDEPMQWYDYPSYILPTVGSAAYSLYEQAEKGETRQGVRPTDWRKERNSGKIPWEMSYKEWLAKRSGGKAPYTADQLSLP